MSDLLDIVPNRRVIKLMAKTSLSGDALNQKIQDEVLKTIFKNTIDLFGDTIDPPAEWLPQIKTEPKLPEFPNARFVTPKFEAKSEPKSENAAFDRQPGTSLTNVNRSERRKQQRLAIKQRHNRENELVHHCVNAAIRSARCFDRRGCPRNADRLNDALEANAWVWQNFEELKALEIKYATRYDKENRQPKN